MFRSPLGAMRQTELGSKDMAASVLTCAAKVVVYSHRSHTRAYEN